MQTYNDDEADNKSNDNNYDGNSNDNNYDDDINDDADQQSSSVRHCEANRSVLVGAAHSDVSEKKTVVCIKNCYRVQTGEIAPPVLSRVIFWRITLI